MPLEKEKNKLWAKSGVLKTEMKKKLLLGGLNLFVKVHMYSK